MTCEMLGLVPQSLYRPLCCTDGKSVLRLGHNAQSGPVVLCCLQGLVKLHCVLQALLQIGLVSLVHSGLSWGSKCLRCSYYMRHWVLYILPLGYLCHWVSRVSSFSLLPDCKQGTGWRLSWLPESAGKHWKGSMMWSIWLLAVFSM